MRKLTAAQFCEFLNDPDYPKWRKEHGIDFHLHSDCSDGSDPVEVLLEKIRQKGLWAFSLTDHDNVEGVKRILKTTETTNHPEENLLFIPGIEFSCKLKNEEAIAHGLDTYDQEGSIRECEFHILGYGMDLEDPDFLQAVAVNRDARVKKVKERILFLRENGYPELTEEDTETIIHEHFNPGKPHIVNLMVAKGLINPDPQKGHQDPKKASRQAIFELLNSIHSKHPTLTPGQAIESIVKAGGIPVLAHGVKGAGSDNFTREETERRVQYLMKFGLKGLECYYSPYESTGYQNGFTPQQQRMMVELADQYGLYKTTGSDYHGGNKENVELGRKRIR